MIDTFDQNIRNGNKDDNLRDDLFYTCRIVVERANA